MTFLKVSTETGVVFYLNASKIERLVPIQGKGCYVHSDNGSTLEVKETVDELLGFRGVQVGPDYPQINYLGGCR